MSHASYWLLALLATIQLLQYVPVTNADAVKLCGQFDSWNSTNPAQPYLFIPNAWGDDGTGGSCLNITDNGAAWSLTYKWTGTPTLVKQYAHMKAWPSNLPVRMSQISHLQLKGNWSTLVQGTENLNASEQALQLHLNAVRSNVAVDMFLSDNATNSTGLNPPIEIMIWPWYSPYVKPLGWAEVDPNQYVVEIAGTNFSMFHGWNDGGQHVFSWLAHKNLTSTDADYGPLIKYIWQKGLLSGDLWVGQLEFGTEVLHSAATTVFSVNNYKMKLIKSGDRDDYTSTMTSTATATANVTRSTTPSTTTASAAATTTSKSAGSSSAFVDVVGRGWLDVLCGMTIMTLFTYIF